jgi:hypothetical protein
VASQPVRPVTPAPAQPATVDKPLPKETFGLYAPEHPVAPKAFPELTAEVTRVSSDSAGASLITLAGNQVWRIDDADPLLAKGDSVTIKRGKLGSFLMSTPSGRLHRAHRVK